MKPRIISGCLSEAKEFYVVAFCLWAVFTGSALADTISVKAFGALGNDSHDDRPAFVAALASLKTAGGGVLMVPAGTYRLQIPTMPANPLNVPKNVTILGVGDQSVLNLDNNGDATGYREFLRFAGSGITLQGLVIQRVAPFPTVLMPLYASVTPTGNTVRDCSIVGNVNPTDDPKTLYCHAFSIGKDSVKDFLLDHSSVSTCHYGFFEDSYQMGNADGITVRDSRFSHNFASDLEFNAPMATVNNVTVSGCTFADNQSTAVTAGWAVGLANIRTASIEKCSITNYRGSGIHVEDRSANVLISGNTLVGTSQQNSSPIVVLNGSHEVTIQGNLIDARAITRAHNLIWVTGGGKNSLGAYYPTPTNIHINANTLLNGAASRTLDLDSGSLSTTSANTIQWECETLVPAVPNANMVTTLTESPFSNHMAHRLDSNAEADFITYTLPFVPAGSYTVVVGIKKSPSYGKFQLAIDGVNQGAEQDEYSTVAAYTQVRSETKVFTGADANHTFNFKVTGSATGCDLVLDYIELVATDQTLSSIVVDPSSDFVYPGANRNFSAAGNTRYGTRMSLQPSFLWSLSSGAGTIDAGTGAYIAPLALGSVVIQAASAGITGTASISVVSPPTTLDVIGDGAGGRSTSLTLKTSVAGRIYQVEYTSSLVSGPWQGVGSPKSGTGGELQFVIPVETGVRSRFYRVRIQ